MTTYCAAIFIASSLLVHQSPAVQVQPDRDDKAPAIAGAPHAQSISSNSPFAPVDILYDSKHFGAFKKSIKDAGANAYLPGPLLRRALECKKSGNALFEALAEALLLAHFPESAEAKFLAGLVDPARFCANQSYLFCTNVAINDPEVRAVLPLAMKNFARLLGKVPQFPGVLPLLALSGSTVDPKAADDGDFPQEDRLIFKILLSKQSDVSKCKKIIASDCGLKYGLVLCLLQESKDQAIKVDEGIVKFCATNLVAWCQYSLALSLLERISHNKADYSTQFIYGWTKVLSGDCRGGEAVFQEMATGPFTEQEIAMALRSLQITKDKTRAENEVAALLDKAVAKFKQVNPDHLTFKFSYPTKQGKFLKGDCLICPAFNKVEMSVFMNGGLFFYYDTSIFGTKIKNETSDLVLKHDRQIFYPTFHFNRYPKNNRNFVMYFFSIISERQYKIPPIMNWTENLAFFGDDAKRADFLKDLSRKGAFFVINNKQDGKEIIICSPEFENFTLCEKYISFDNDCKFKSLKIENLQVTDFQYGINFDEAKLDEKMPKLNSIYKTAGELYNASMHFFRFEPAFASVFQ